jgi:CBS domain-containing protein
MRMTVGDLMCETPVTVGPDCTTDEALEAFFEYETPELYVVDKSGRLLGVLPDYELLKTQLSGEARGARVEQLMSRSVPVFGVDVDAAEVAKLFRDNQCSRMPVVKSGRLVGVVTRSDVLRLMVVLRRIDAQPVKNSAGPKRPKLLDTNKPSKTRKARAKTMSAKAAPSRNRSRSSNKRSRTVAIH